MKLIFASNNQHKIEEIQSVLNDDELSIITLKQAGIDIEIAEPFDTLEENASSKCRTIYELTGRDCFSEDTGLEVEALNGEPGVKSARYAGEERSFDKNIEKLLLKLSDKQNRKARFRAVISLLLNGEEFRFEGITNGRITESPVGSLGFGYDPVFIPEGESRTFGQMSLVEKNNFSHRVNAFRKMVTFLQTTTKSR